MRAEFTPPLPTEACRSRRGPLVAHVIYRLDVGGLENGLVNLINHIPGERFNHAIICLTGYTDFRSRIRRPDVPVFALEKPPGNSPGTHVKLWHLLRALRPDIVHTRNIAALEYALPAALAGVPVRIHGEHGRDVDDLDGSNWRYRWVRRLLKPFVHGYIALSQDLERYLREDIGVPPSRVIHICNGVDTERFYAAQTGREPLPVPQFQGENLFVIGTVGRMQAVKNPLNLVRAFILLLQRLPDAKSRLRLAMVGDGPLRGEALRLLEEAGAADLAWLPGSRDDVPALLRGFDLFVLPSLAEGISNTILEAMATGLPVVATRVGGNPELVEEGRTGMLVPPDDPKALAEAVRAYVADQELGRRHGAEARHAAERRFSLDVMVESYMGVYDRLLKERGRYGGSQTKSASSLPLDRGGLGRG